MKNIALTIAATVIGLQCLGETTSVAKDTTSVAKEASPMAKEYSKKYQDFMKSQGGIIVKPNSAKGLALIYNAQKTAASSNVASVAKRLSKELRMNFVAEDGTLAGVNGDWKALKERKGAAMIVVLVEEGPQPSLLLSPDEQWAVINVSKLGEGLTTAEARAKFVPGRVTRQIYRAFALLGGSGKANKESPSTVRSLNELDLARNALPVETLGTLAHQLEGHGMTREVHATYKQACTLGWAPAPTNDYQKAIWEKVHALPTNPIKIKPETKKIKE